MKHPNVLKFIRLAKKNPELRGRLHNLVVGSNVTLAEQIVQIARDFQIPFTSAEWRGTLCAIAKEVDSVELNERQLSIVAGGVETFGMENGTLEFLNALLDSSDVLVSP